MIYNTTTLRKNIYSVLDSVIETGIPVEIERKGKRLRIVPEETGGRLERLEPHTIVTGNTEDLPDLHWDNIWTGSKLP